MAKTDLWMPFYIGPYLADTTQLSQCQHAAYILALFYEWVRGPLPNDMAAVAQIMKFQGGDASSNARAILSMYFRQQKDGSWTQKRLEIEKRRAQDRAEVYAERAVKAARARWKGHKAKRKRRSATSIPNGVHEQSPRQLSTKSKTVPHSVRDSPKSRSGTAKRPVGQQTGKPLAQRPNGHEKKRAHGAPNGIGEATNDPRFGPFKDEIHKFFSEANPKVKKVPWTGAANAALRDLLQASDGGLPDLRGWLRNRALSIAAGEYNAWDYPHRWLRKLPAFASGPLTRYGEPLRKR